MKNIFKQSLLIALSVIITPQVLLGGILSNIPIQTNQEWCWECIPNQDKNLTVFAHGLGADYWHGITYANFDRYRSILPSVERSEIENDGRETTWRENNYITFNFPDTPLKPLGNKKTGIAQKSEMKRLEEAIECARKHLRELVLFGVSRGASTIANVVGKWAKEHKKCDDIKALVLESPFAHCRDCVLHLAKKLNNWVSPSTINWGAKWIYGEYCEKCNIPAEWARHIPTDMSILLVCCTYDDIVPASSTKKLYKALKDSGHTNVYLFEAEHGTHANILNGENARDYVCVLNAFYKKHGISHNEEFAQEGEELLAQCQPEIE